MRCPAVLALLAMTAFTPLAARAQGIDLSSGGPVQVNAAGGIDWQQADQTVTAHGDARAVRGNVTVTGDELIAHYRKKAASAGSAAAPAKVPAKIPAQANAKPDAKTQSADAADDPAGGSEVYRLDAVGNVHIFTPTDQAWGDKAVYDMDQSVLVLTGHNLRLLTPQDLLTAKDSMEYWPDRHVAVARGNAVVLTNDGRRLAGDVLVAYTTPGQGNPTPPQQPTSPDQPAPAANPVQTVAAKPPADPLLASGKLQKVEAYGNVDVRTPTETVHGDRGVYVPDTQRALVVGHVRITRGQNQLNGNAADVNMRTGVATLLSGGSRVQGLIVPNDTPPGATQPKPAKAPKAPKTTTPSKAAP